MALMFVDSFDMTPASVDGVNAADHYRKWLNNTAILMSTGGRRNGGYIRTSYTSRLLYGFNGIDEIIFGAAIKQPEGFLGTSGGSSKFLMFGYDEYWPWIIGSTDSGALYVEKYSYTSNGSLINPPMTLRTRDGLFHSGDWYHLEVRMKFGASGTIRMRVNDEEVITYSGETRNQAGLTPTVVVPNLFNWIGLGSYLSNTVGMYFDDVYLCNALGATNNDFLGDCRVDVVYPIADSGPNQFTATPAGGDNYTKVDESRWDLASSYVSSSNPGDRDIYAFGDVTSSSDVYYGIQINAVARKSDAGPRRMKILTRSGGVVYSSSDYYLNETAFIDHLQIRETNPATGTAWTDASISSAEFGVEVV